MAPYCVCSSPRRAYADDDSSTSVCDFSQPAEQSNQPVAAMAAEEGVEKSRVVAPQPPFKKMSLLERRRLNVKLPELKTGHPQAEMPLLLTRRSAKREMPKVAIEKPDFMLEVDPWQGQYKILETAGRTIASRVERAIRSSDGKEVALKTMWSRELEILHTAVAEFQTLQRLKHVNIVKALDFHTVGGRAVMVMEYFDGAPLDQVVRHHPAHFTEARSRAYAAQLFGAVSHVHAQGIIHRDIEPPNTLVCLERGALMLIDFNTACDWASGDPALMPAGDQVYMAPEEVRGQPSSPASDVWGAALCAYLMLSGKLPQARHRCELSRDALEFAAKKPVNFQGKLWAKVSESCKSCLATCLAIDETARPDADVALSSWNVDFVEEGNLDLSVEVQPPAQNILYADVVARGASKEVCCKEGLRGKVQGWRLPPTIDEKTMCERFVTSGCCSREANLSTAGMSLNVQRAPLQFSDGFDERSTMDVDDSFPAPYLSERNTERFTEDFPSSYLSERNTERFTEEFPPSYLSERNTERFTEDFPASYLSERNTERFTEDFPPSYLSERNTERFTEDCPASYLSERAAGDHDHNGFEAAAWPSESLPCSLLLGEFTDSCYFG